MNALLVKVTDATNNEVSFIDAAHIRLISRAPPPARRIVGEAQASKPRNTLIVTYYQVPSTGQFQSFEVLEDVEEVGRRVNAARAGKDLSFS